MAKGQSTGSGPGRFPYANGEQVLLEKKKHDINMTFF
jgi:hypothetical protein